MYGPIRWSGFIGLLSCPSADAELDSTEAISDPRRERDRRERAEEPNHGFDFEPITCRVPEGEQAACRHYEDNLCEIEGDEGAPSQRLDAGLSNERRAMPECPGLFVG